MPAVQVPKLSQDNFAEWLQYITQPASADGYARVGFHTTLWEAVVRANLEDKPILLWAMNGHPMACT